MSSRYKQVVDGEWLPLARRVKVACCDCGLVHRVEYRTRKGKLEIRRTVDLRATAAIRREARKRGLRVAV